ncbi:MAG: VOC family protein [Chloroflexi bacterium]|nr:VOC family protein [Chloroflexota bacterium]
MFTRVHHVGLVVGDLEAAKKLWLDAYGFTVDEARSPLPHGRHVPLDDVNILDIPVGEGELELNKANDPNSGTGRYLARRGPGPHHLCLYSNDIDADVKRLKDAGQQLILGPTGARDQSGGSRVAFFHPRSNLGFLLEVWQNMPVGGLVPQPPRGVGGRFTHFHHVGVVCATPQEALRLFHDQYGLPVDEERSDLPNGRFVASDNVRILEFPIGESRIEVSMPQDQASGTARFLASRGSGLHHVCFYSQDIAYDAARLRAAGLQQLGDLPPARSGASRVTFFHPRSNMGVLVELWQDIP